jgi:hypothetical protein
MLVLFPPPGHRPYEQYRAVRQAYLEAACLVAKRVCPEALDIVGIATEAGMGERRSEDAMYVDARLWTDELAAEAAVLQRDLRILTNPTEFSGVEKEYPDIVP